MIHRLDVSEAKLPFENRILYAFTAKWKKYKQTIALRHYLVLFK
jgi:hypothetical protein